MSENEDLLRLDGDVEDFSFSPSDADGLDLEFIDFREQEGLEYPAILLSNVLFMDCLHVLKKMKRESYREFSTWVAIPGEQSFQNIGTIQLDSTVLLAMRYLHIGVTAYYSAENVEVLDLDNPEVLERFI